MFTSNQYVIAVIVVMFIIVIACCKSPDYYTSKPNVMFDSDIQGELDAGVVPNINIAPNGSKLNSATYIDVPLYLAKDVDNLTAPNYRTVTNGVYVPNSLTYWMGTNTPYEAAFW